MNETHGRNNNILKSNISISISIPLLTKVDQNIKGKSRSDKLAKCIEKGYPIVLKEQENAKP